MCMANNMLNKFKTLKLILTHSLFTFYILKAIFVVVLPRAKF